MDTVAESELTKDLEASLMLVKLRRIANRLCMDEEDWGICVDPDAGY